MEAAARELAQSSCLYSAIRATHRSYTIRYEYLMARAVMQQPASIVGRDQIKTN